MVDVVVCVWPSAHTLGQLLIYHAVPLAIGGLVCPPEASVKLGARYEALGKRERGWLFGPPGEAREREGPRAYTWTTAPGETPGFQDTKVLTTVGIHDIRIPRNRH